MIQKCTGTKADVTLKRQKRWGTMGKQNKAYAVQQSVLYIPHQVDRTDRDGQADNPTDRKIANYGDVMCVVCGHPACHEENDFLFCSLMPFTIFALLFLSPSY